MYKAQMSPIAREDLHNALDYIQRQLSAPVATPDFLDEVDKCLDNLEHDPFMYEKCRAAHLAVKGFRRAIVKNYLLPYSVNEDQRLVTIHHVVYGARDYESMM